MGDWPVLSSNVELGDPKSNVAVLTLASELKIPKNKVAAFGPLKTENIGIERMIQNVVANPMIRYIVVCGQESPGHESGLALLKLHKNGVDGANRIVGGGKMAYVHNLDQKVIGHFRDQVEVIDMIGEDDLNRIVERIDSLPKKKPYPSRIEPEHVVKLDIAKLRPTHESYLTPNIVYSDTLSDAWYRALRRVWNAGNIVEKDQWGSNTKEIQNLVVMISDPLKEPMHHKSFNWDRKRLEEYSKEYLSPNKGDFEYTYGERLTNWGDASIGEASFIVDQIREVVIPELRKSPKTRRAITVTLNPKIDVKLTSPPCMVTNQFIYRSGRLHLTTYFRSHDIFGASLANWFALTRLLEFVSKKTGVKPGTITSVSASAHIYETDFQKTLQVLKSASNEELVAQPHKFQPDPEGFFTIETNSNQIIVRYFVPIYQGGPGILNQVVKGTNPKEIYETISRLNILSRYDHAAYLGSELQKAHMAIKRKKKYVQDGEIE